jgi:hypothetical protein
MIRRLLAAVVRTYDYCPTCGWWAKDCPGH